MINAAPAFGNRLPGGNHPERRVTEAFWLAAATLVLLVGFVLFLDNCFIINANGLWKSVYVRQWAENPATAPVDFSNLLYFPIYGLLCRVLDGFGIFSGQVWRQMAFLNTGFAAAGIGLIYLWITAAFGSRLVGLLTALFYLGTGFFLALAVINEDIMSSYVWTLAGMMLAGLWFGRPSAVRIVLVALVVSVGWLSEWRLMFPVVPPMALALWVSADHWRQRLGRIALFVSGLVMLPLLLTSSLIVRGTCTQTLGCLAQMFWTGKGVGTGWAGFSLMKIRLAWVGITQSVLGGRYLGSDNWVQHPVHVVEVALGSVLVIALAVMALRYAWSRRAEPCVVSHAIIFGGTFVAGEVFNLYSQPQDPQMQLTVMPWVILGWAVLMSQWFGPVVPAGFRPFKGRQRHRVVAALTICLMPLTYNAAVLARDRGGNERYLSLLTRLEQRFDPSITVFLYRGFDFVVPWHWAEWSPTNPGVADLGAAPAVVPKFKWISVAETLIRHPGWSKDQQAADVSTQVEHALALGYQVVANEIWELPEQGWIDALSTVGTAEHIAAIRDVLTKDFDGEVIYRDPVGGVHYRLIRRPRELQ